MSLIGLIYELISVQAMFHQTSHLPLHYPESSQWPSSKYSLILLAEGNRR